MPTELDNLPTTALQAPVAVVSKGKKRTRRFRSAGEHGPGKYSIATRCEHCGTTGHNRDRCPQRLHSDDNDSEPADVVRVLHTDQLQQLQRHKQSEHYEAVLQYYAMQQAAVLQDNSSSATSEAQLLHHEQLIQQQQRSEQRVNFAMSQRQQQQQSSRPFSIEQELDSMQQQQNPYSASQTELPAAGLKRRRLTCSACKQVGHNKSNSKCLKFDKANTTTQSTNSCTMLPLQTAALHAQALQNSSSSSSSSSVTDALVPFYDYSTDWNTAAQRYCADANTSTTALTAKIKHVYSNSTSSSSSSSAFYGTQKHPTAAAAAAAAVYSGNSSAFSASSNSYNSNSSNSSAINSAQQHAAAAAPATYSVSSGVCGASSNNPNRNSSANNSTQQHATAAAAAAAASVYSGNGSAGESAIDLPWATSALASYEPPHEDKTQLAALHTRISKALFKMYLKKNKYNKCRQLLTRDNLPERLLAVQHKGTVFDPLGNGICGWYCLMFISHAIQIGAMTTSAV